MKWYDYLACIWFADIVAASILHMQIIPLTLGIFSYIMYTDFRKGLNNENNDS
jgi:hypothetical protein